MENNGLVLAKLIDTLYQIYHSTLSEDFVVVGASMGGLVSRFGLAWMEQNNKPHHTRLFISFDSPQNGANIPLGIQHMINNFTQNGILTLSAKIRNSSHYSNAAKQLLIHHTDTESESTQAHPFRQQWINNVAAVGDYPKQCRIVSIINGNKNGILKNITPNPQEIPPITEKDEYLDFGIKRKLALGCNLNICYKLHVQSYAQSANGRFKTHQFTLNSFVPLIQLFAPTLPFIATTKYNVPENNNSYDVAPGSRLRMNPFAKFESGKTHNWINFIGVLAGGIASPTLVFNKNNVKFINFIPTISSIAYTYPNNETRNLYKNFTNVNLTRCAGTTPFDTVYAYGTDMLHVDIDRNIAAAFRSEVYFNKTRAVCQGDCPEYITKNENILTSPTYLNAAKAINLNPNFKVDNGKIFKAEIGCNNSVLILTKPIILPPTSLSICNIEWDVPNNEITCGVGFTNFKAFVKFLDFNTYAEFSTNGFTWFRANISDNGYNINLNANPGQPQLFFARDKNNPSLVISGNLYHCN
jgi:hypothetical protein